MSAPKSLQEKTMEEALANLRKLGGELFREESVVFDGRKVILPEGSTIASNIKFLQAVQASEGEYTEWRRVYKYRPADGQVATMRALKQAFGMITHSGGMGFFGPNPPRLVEVATGLDSFEQVPNLGDEVKVPALPDVSMTLGYDMDDELGPVFCLYASGPRGRTAEVEGLFNLVGRQLQDHSIYKGQAITANLDFVDLSKVNPSQVVYSEEVFAGLERAIFAPIELDQELEAAGIDPKGAVLLYGPFGTGKTLAGYLTGQRATAHGWTSVLCESGSDIFDALKLARILAPAVVFYEDVDVLTRDADAERIQLLLEAFDGVRRKGDPVRVVLTTNYPDAISPGMVRPGRIDAVIEVGKPDAGAIKRLVELNTPSLDPDISEDGWAEVTKAAEDFLPCYVVQACEDAYTDALIRSKKKGGSAIVVESDLIHAVRGLYAHRNLQEGQKPKSDQKSIEAVVAQAVKPIVGEVLAETLDPRLVRNGG